MVRERMRDRCGLVSANVGKPKWDLNKAHVASLIDQTPKMSSSTKRMWFGCQIKFEQSQNEISKLYTTTGIYNAFIAFINKSSLCVQNYSCFYFPFYWKRGLDPHSNASLEQDLPKMSPTWGAGLPKHRPERLFEFERILFFPPLLMMFLRDGSVDAPWTPISPRWSTMPSFRQFIRLVGCGWRMKNA